MAKLVIYNNSAKKLAFRKETALGGLVEFKTVAATSGAQVFSVELTSSGDDYFCWNQEPKELLKEKCKSQYNFPDYDRTLVVTGSVKDGVLVDVTFSDTIVLAALSDVIVGFDEEDTVTDKE